MMLHNGHVRINLNRLEEDPDALFRWCFDHFYRLTASEPSPRELRFYMDMARDTSS